MSAWPRRIHAPLQNAKEERLAAFVGVFGRRWVENTIDNLERQEVQSIQVVMAVNGSDLAIEERLLDFQRTTRHSIWVVVNETNLGPGGSWEVNRELIDAPWISYLHQDDVYLANHLATLLEVTSRADPHLQAVFTGLDGLGDDGRSRVAGPPQVNRHLSRRASYEVLPEIIRRHPFPTPTFCLRASGAVPDMAWYDSGAPDSEWCARLACRGEIEVIERVTALYRRPASSESSATDWESRAWMWANSLNRILLSKDFANLLSTIPESERSTFVDELLDAIPFRYPSSPIFGFLQFVAGQVMSSSWDYREPHSLAFLRNSLEMVGHSAARKSVESLLNTQVVSIPAGIDGSALLGPPPRIGRFEKVSRKTYRRVGHWIPRSLRLRLYGRLRANRRGRVS